MALFAFAIFLSALLLFLVQPIVGKQILPWFGGSASVWSTCLVFFQTALLIGYLYSHYLSKLRDLRWQALVHCAFIVLAIGLLPIVPNEQLKPLADDNPMLRILWVLSTTIGLPYVLLSATSPLLQAWLVRQDSAAQPYRLFALSNFASLLALLGYPFVVERLLTSRQQAFAWSFGFVTFAIAIGVVLARGWRVQSRTQTPVPRAPSDNLAGSPIDYVVWIVLAALGSCLLLGVTNHLTQNIPSFPLMWLLPLTIYLVTYILAFNAKDGRPTWYPRALELPLTVAALCAMALLITTRRFDFKLWLQVGVFSIGLFVACLYCHGELARRTPDARRLTSYYLAISIGGALGSMLIGIVAPLTLSAYYELGITLYVVAVVGTWLTWRKLHRIWNALALAVCVFLLLTCIRTDSEFRKDVIAMSRNFYGVVRVKEYASHDREAKRWLVHGAILHGDQYLDPIRRRTPTTYYNAVSGIGLALTLKEKTLGRPKRVGVIGLGAGTIAAYGRDGDVFRFYEIDPSVVTIAKSYFTYVGDSAATVVIALGDARLNLEREASQRFDVLAIDAFSGDSIPIHLITREALAIYLKHVQDDGIIAFHVSNRFLELHPVVQALAEDRGLQASWIEEVRDNGSTASDWILLSKDPRVLADPLIANAAQPIPRRPDWRLWTDDFNTLVRALK